MYIVLTDAQLAKMRKILAGVSEGVGQIHGILDAAVADCSASTAVEGKKKPGRPRKAKSDKAAPVQGADIMA